MLHVMAAAGRRLSFLLVLTLVPLRVLPAFAGDGRPDPLSWKELVDTYAGDYPAVVLKHTYEVEILFDSHLNMSSRITDRRELAVFDVEKAQEHLTLSFLMSKDMKIKKKKAWSMELQNGVFVSGAAAQESDFSVKDLNRGLRSLQVAAPGISHSGYVTYEVELQGKGPPFYEFKFYNDLPVRYGRCDIHVPATGAGSRPGVGYMLQYVAIYTRGEVKRIEIPSANREVSMSWEVSDLPARFDEELVPAAYQPQAAIHVVPAGMKWAGLVRYLHEQLGATKAPKGMVKAARDSLAGRSSREIVQALARYLDDPEHFQLVGNPRELYVWFGGFENAARTGKGRVFDKALLASRLLDALDVEHHLVLGGSQYRSVPQWLVPGMGEMDAVLIWIPSIDPGFLWDVGNITSPLGIPGGDLYDDMLVVDPEADNPVKTFKVGHGVNREIRTLEYTLDQEGVLSGDWSCRYESYPMRRKLSPWDREADLDTEVSEVMPSTVEVRDAVWQDADWVSMRCTQDSPAVLACRVEHEALPSGESGWEVRPFYMALPERLAALVGKERRGPLYLENQTEIVDRVFIQLDGQTAPEVPSVVQESTPVGLFYSGWEIRDNGVFATRKLNIRPGFLTASDVGDLQVLFRAWKNAEEQSVRVE